MHVNDDPIFLKRKTAFGLTLLYLAVAFLLLTNFGHSVTVPQKLGLVFNDMAARLMAWDFTISASVIKYEAFYIHGAATTYYGIFPALLRLPFVAAGLKSIEYGNFSCLLALGLTVYAYLRLFQLALSGSAWSHSTLLAWVALGSVVLTGPQIFVLASASLYHELIFWAAALVALFNLVVLTRWWRGQDLSAPDLIVLAVLAGCCLLCRLPDGLGLYAALLLLVTRLIAIRLAQAPSGQRIAVLVSMPPWLVSLMAACAVALAFVLVQALVDWERFGDPLATSPYQYYVQFRDKPAALARFARHGLFSWQRLLLAVAYYGSGIKVEQLFPSAFADVYGGIEGPRAVIPICEPLLFLLAARGVWWLRHRTAEAVVPALLIGSNLVGVIIVLGFQALCLRYTFDCWALLMLCCAVALRNWSGGAAPARWLPAAACLLLVAGVLGSGLTLLRYKIVYSGTDPAVRYALSARLQPALCPHATLTKTVRLTDFNPLVTPSCPPLW